jgi:GT2 family glycosyltransferase
MSVAVTIVTYNSARFIERCLEYVLAQNYPALEVVVVDNASADGTPALLERFRDRVNVVLNRTNQGFAGGQNQAIRMTRADWLLTLNPDVRLSADFVSRLVAAGEADTTAGTVCGKLLGMADDFEIPAEAVFDSTGIFMTPNLRHFDRGSRVADRGQYDRREYVFGATGAAALYRRRMIEDVSVDGEFFDEDFFAYREDADVAWRAQLLGWRCLYVPEAKAYHVRNVLPSNRRSVARNINMHSVKNRFLLRIKNATADLYRRYWLPITMRDVVVIGGCVLREVSSLSAFWLVGRRFQRTWGKRRVIMQKRRASDAYITSWFSDQPVSYPAGQSFASSVQEKMPSR